LQLSRCCKLCKFLWLSLICPVSLPPLCRLCKCGLTVADCAAVVSALRTNPSYLKDLDLSDNTLRTCPIYSKDRTKTQKDARQTR
uniref:Uncharacterized protein n=1 Tax=Paramormyrops kingsleyae TaxID=1676925 RepID=A0A3B3R0S1_9TELE